MRPKAEGVPEKNKSIKNTTLVIMPNVAQSFVLKETVLINFPDLAFALFFQAYKRKTVMLV